MDEEIWKDIVGFEGMYQVSNKGRVKRLETEKRYPYILRSHCRDVTLSVNLATPDGRRVYRPVHRLVAEAFVPKPETNGIKLNYVMHKDGNPANNTPENLYWTNRMEERLRTWAVPIEQRTKNGVLVRRYPSITAAAKAVGVAISSISVACDNTSRRKTAAGYVWKRLQDKYEKRD